MLIQMKLNKENVFRNDVVLPWIFNMQDTVTDSLEEEKSCTKGHSLPSSNKHALTGKNVVDTLL
jgi:hypothetical protein